MKVGLGIGALVLAALAFEPRTDTLSAPTRAQGGFTIASLNLDRAMNVDEIVYELKAQGLVPSADVILFQEVAKPAAGDIGAAVGAKLGYSAVAIPSDTSAPNQGLTILSHAPLDDVRVIPLKHFDLKFHTRVRFAVGAVTQLGGKRVRVWNVHLDTRISPEERLTQLEPVLGELGRESEAAVIGGDFNTVDFHWAFNVIPLMHRGSQGAALVKRMQGLGFAPALAEDKVTYPFLRQHLDWIFARGLTSDDSGAVRMRLTDHHAVWARLR